MGIEDTFAKACEVMGAEKGYLNEKLVYDRTKGFPMTTDIDGLETAIRLVQSTTCPPEPDAKKSPKRAKVFETGFNMARHIILQQLREEQNRRFRSRVEKTNV